MKSEQEYLNELNTYLTSDNYSNEFLESAMNLLIDLEELRGDSRYNKVMFKARRLNRMLQEEFQSSSFQLYCNGVNHPGAEYDIIETYPNSIHKDIF